MRRNRPPKSLALFVVLVTALGFAELVECCDEWGDACHATQGTAGISRSDCEAHHGAHCTCGCHLAPVVTASVRLLAAVPICDLDGDLQICWPSRSLPRLFRPPIALDV